MQGAINYRALETDRRAKSLRKGMSVEFAGRWRPIDNIVQVDGVVSAQLDWQFHVSWDSEEVVHCLVWIPTND